MSEGFFVDARKAIHVDLGDRGYTRTKGQGLEVVFRRLYCDSSAAARFETGIVHRRSARTWQDQGPTATAMLNTVLELPVRLRADPDGSYRPLVQFGSTFARTFARSTTRRAECEPRLPTWWVTHASPMVVLEGDGEQQVEFSHKWHIVRGQRVSVWRIWRPTWGERDLRTIRRMRIHLSRLHTELAGLEKVLALCSSGRLDLADEPLRDYLNRTCGQLLRKSRYGLEQRPFLSQALDAAHDEYAEQIAQLRLLSARIDSKGLSRKVGETAALFEHIISEAGPPGPIYVHTGTGDIVAEKQQDTHVHATNIGALHSGTGDLSNNRITIDSGATAEDIATLLRHLTSEFAALRPHLGDQEADVAEDTMARVAGELQSAEPDQPAVRRRLVSLLELAGSAGAAGAGLAAAIQALRSALGF
jgi:hypothetical protein